MGLVLWLQEFPLGRYNNKKDLKDAVKKMAYMERGTMTGLALRYLTDNSFSPGQGARPGVAKVGIVFTDGRSQDYIGDAAKKAKDQGRRGRRAGWGANTRARFCKIPHWLLMPQASRCTPWEWATPWRTS